MIFFTSFVLLLAYCAFSSQSAQLSMLAQEVDLTITDYDCEDDKNERYIRIEASNLYDAGFEVGRRTARRIRAYVQTDELVELLNFVQTPTGAATFAALKRDNSKSFPDLVEEIKGVANGARVSENIVWIANLVPELTGNIPEGHTIVDEADIMHCSDIYSYDNEGNAMQAHTEDWSPIVAPLFFLLDYIPTEDATFSKCAGFAYPATLIGYGPAWNGNGMYHTQNTLLSGESRGDGGWACTLAQRNAMCGGEGSKSLEEYIRRIHEEEWATGSNLNVVDLQNNIMASVENWMHDISVHWVPPNQNYSHFNWYQHLGSAIKVDQAQDRIENILRQMRIYAQPPPRTYEQIRDYIADTHDLGDDFRGHRVSIRRYNTLATFIVDRSRGTLDVWAEKVPTESPPQWTWKLI